MHIENLDKNIIYRLCTELQRRSHCGPIEADFLYRIFSDIPNDHIAAHIQTLMDNGWIDADETGSMLTLTDRGRAHIRSIIPSKRTDSCVEPEACRSR